MHIGRRHIGPDEWGRRVRLAEHMERGCASMEVRQDEEKRGIDENGEIERGDRDAKRLRPKSAVAVQDLS
jgi:hypothetical protein